MKQVATKTKAPDKHPTLPLKGERGGTLKTMDGTGTVYSPPEPIVKERAQRYADCLDGIARLKTRANDYAQDLLESLLKSKKTRKVTINGATQTYVFTTKTLTKLFTQKEKALK